jgi:hypothetical protein
MFNEINEGGLNQILTRRLGMQGGASAPGVAPEVFPVLTLENDRPEWGYLKGERTCGKYDAVNAVAGQFSIAQLYLPSTSNEVAVITNIQRHTGADFSIARLVGIGGGLGGFAARTTATRDFRWNGERTSLILERTNNVALPTRFPDLFGFTAVQTSFTEPIVITPGTGLGLFGIAVNTTIVFSVQWRERPANPGELV